MAHLPALISDMFDLSRSEARRLIAAGKVQVNGEIASLDDMRMESDGNIKIGSDERHVEVPARDPFLPDDVLGTISELERRGCRSDMARFAPGSAYRGLHAKLLDAEDERDTAKSALMELENRLESLLFELERTAINPDEVVKAITGLVYGEKA